MPKTIALEKAGCESFRSPSLPGRRQQAFPWSPLCFCSAIPTPPEAATFQILPLSPTAELCVLGCSEHEIPALSVVAGAWNLLLCATVWFVVSLNMTVQVSASTTAGWCLVLISK